MEKFNEFKLENQEFIFGGDLVPTYVGANGDFYDTETKAFIILLEPIN